MSGSKVKEVGTPGVVPVYLDEPSISILPNAGPTEYLWPLQGNPALAAQSLAKTVGSEKSAAHYTRQLEVCADLFRDGRQASPAGRQLVEITILRQFPDKNAGSEDAFVIYIDRVLWDLNTPLVMVEVYCARIAQDLGLGTRESMYIVSDMRKKVEAARQAAAKGVAKLVSLDEEQAVRKSKVSYPTLLRGHRAKEFMEKQRKQRKSSEMKEVKEEVKEEGAKAAGVIVKEEEGKGGEKKEIKKEEADNMEIG